MLQSGAKCYCKDKISTVSKTKTELSLAVCLELQKIIDALIAPGKGLLTCDESPSNLDEIFQSLGIESNEFIRRDWREILLSAENSMTPLSQYISGVILNHETIYQRTSENMEFIELLRRKKIITGVKVDRGLVPLFGTEDEKTTQGLDDLREVCIKYKKEGCHFAKWRCVFSITERCPSQLTMIANAHVLARYAIICQNARIVPIVEPEVLSSIEHGIDRALQVHEEVLSILFRTLHEHHVYLEGMLLNPAMVLSGIKTQIKCAPQIVAEYTLTALQRTVPVAVPAIIFLSGGQTDEESVVNLNAINTYITRKPWKLTFCYGRALQNTAMKAWKGKPENVEKAQGIFFERCKLCSEASLGQMQITEEDICINDAEIV